MTLTSLPYTKDNPCLAPLKSITPLHKEGADKQVYHIVLDISAWQGPAPVGASFGILPKNCPQRIEHLTQLLQTNSTEIFTHTRTDTQLTLGQILSEKSNLDRVNPKLLSLCNSYASNDKLDTLLNDSALRKAYCQSVDLEMFCKEFYHPDIPLQELLDTLSPLLPRYYSIASSQMLYPNEVHFMVEVISYTLGSKKKQGVAGQYLTQTRTRQETVPLFLLENLHFTPPQDPNTPMIMIGPGTGLAPYLGFLQERIATKAPGHHMLFTGARHRKNSFYYEETLTSYTQKTSLDLITAFSRDQTQRIYVQHRMQERSKQLYNLIHHENAHIYICGSKDPMAKDVQAALQGIIQAESNLPPEEAAAYVKNLRKTRRLVLDVY